MEEDDKEFAIKNIFKSFSLLFFADTSLYEDLCPRCGSRGIVSVNDSFKCPSCETKYRRILVDDKLCIWLKSLGR